MFDQKTLKRLKQFILLRVRDEEDAEEILQETLISAYQSLPSFTGHSTFFVWLCGIAKHEISDFYRKKKIKAVLFSRLPFLENLVSEAFSPEEEMIEKELKKKIRRVLGTLGEGYRQVLRLKYIDGHSVAQIAGRLDLTLKAVESRLTRARFAFRKIWVENAEVNDHKKSRFKPLR